MSEIVLHLDPDDGTPRACGPYGDEDLCDCNPGPEKFCPAQWYSGDPEHPCKPGSEGKFSVRFAVCQQSQ
jgi:hypothetical protein